MYVPLHKKMKKNSENWKKTEKTSSYIRNDFTGFFAKKEKTDIYVAKIMKNSRKWKSDPKKSFC